MSDVNRALWQDVVRRHLTSAGADWAKSAGELREILLGGAARIDELERRVRRLEGRRDDEST